MRLRGLLLLVASVAALGCQLVFPYDDGAGGATTQGSTSSAMTASSTGMDPCAGVDFDRDADNCGTCGHGCQGGKCAGGACQPFVLADNLPEPNTVAVTGATLVWGTGGQVPGTGVSKIDLHGGLPKLVAGGDYISTVLVDGDEVYWTSPDGVRRATVAGTGITTLVGSINPTSMAQDADRVYWFDFMTQAISSRNKKGSGGPQVLFMNQGGTVNGIVVLGQQMYWTPAGGSAVQYGPITGGAATPLAPNQNAPAGIAVDATGVYWAENGDPDLENGAIHAIPLSGGKVRTLASGQAHPFGVCLDDDHVYWTNQGSAPSYTDGSVARAAKSGPTKLTVLATKQHNPVAITADALRVYWANRGDGMASNGSLVNVAK